MLFNISFVIGGSPDAGWTAYFPLASIEFSPTVGNNYYSIALQIAGIGTLMTGVNFVATILKMRAPGMTLMKMPMFTWSVLVTCVIIMFAFPVLTVALALMMFDRLFGSQFFTMANGGMDMLWANLFWVWGHPEVYIVILPAFGIYSEIIATFRAKPVRLQIHGIQYGRHFAAVVYRMGAPLLYDGPWRDGQRRVLDYDDGNRGADRG
ncbi:hypothetical protein HMSSN036_76250 [Paenibacillus macerans]|nr:hypothetical protein HMSSN036_76250 [Paenibacillus macerans]